MKVIYSLAWLSLLPAAMPAQNHDVFQGNHPNIVCIFMAEFNLQMQQNSD
ncbi:hypothetical protein [Phocaeicola coprocola]|nr:hypothetical protein [Phocaeicola coprocola]MBV3868694.1 hypothetical protein [Phocaeicola coprocola]MBV4009858.1 hypothetical protein [Phocaeicola coprocola]MBV4034337.1 hypothetical protein [Phocaeicola coprocola]MBV4040937.1 hypothetical protein [Phocaeicola coprocola]MBV4062495.1 hypothetical protein [Phocaeicola coprocola]